MKYGIISDIHGNFEALTAVIVALDKANVDHIICLGDIIGYGPDPEKCVELIQEKADTVLAGNHDHAPLGLIDTTFFNPYAKQAVEWTRLRLASKTRHYLKDLPLRHDFDTFTVVHATPSAPEAWNYILSLDDALENFAFFDTQACFIGHSHVPIIIEQAPEKNVRVIRKFSQKFAENTKYIVNVGSVGQPRDLDPRAAYAIFDTERAYFDLKRTRYDVAITQQKILERGLPTFLAERLATGQ